MYSAQAWHWIRPEVAYDRAASALMPGGALAVFWNRVQWDQVALRAELSRAYARAAPRFVGRPGPMHPDAPTDTHWMTDWAPAAVAEAGFATPQASDYPWAVRYSTASYLDLLRTHSDHVLLDDEPRRELLEGVAQVIEAHGGAIELAYATRLLMARLERG